MKAQSNEKKNWLLSISAIMAGMLLLIIPYLKTTAVPKYTATNVTVNVSGDHIQIKGKLNISNNVREVYFPTWRILDNQKDLKWWKGTRNGTEISATIDMKDHGYVAGEYVTHIYVVDQTGYVYVTDVTFQYSKKQSKPTFTNEIFEDNSGYRVIYTVANSSNIDHLGFPTWTEANGQDDIIWRKSSISQDDHYFFWGKRSEHNNENGIYHIHAYIKNRSGDCTVFETKIDYTKPLPKLISIKHNNVTDKAFDIVYQIEMPEGIDIASAVSPTWSYADVPSNITWNQPTIQWSGRTATITCHHNAADGKQKYYSHLHLQDSLGRKMIYGTELYLK
ncbi:MAG: GBS Bsp-like repeat-containing protein [Clostridiales bacterium]|nr:GBS Bsp-like repeat-containing protein [Clostridiales bacterium]